jgi:hypothetical protein
MAYTQVAMGYGTRALLQMLVLSQPHQGFSWPAWYPDWRTEAKSIAQVEALFYRQLPFQHPYWLTIELYRDVSPFGIRTEAESPLAGYS